MSNIIEKPPSFGAALFSPRAVALVGASGNLKKNTARPMRFMRKHGFKDTIYPINPGQAEVMGEKAYPGLEALPGPIDHAFIMVSSDQVPALLEPCAKAGARVAPIRPSSSSSPSPQPSACSKAVCHHVPRHSMSAQLRLVAVAARTHPGMQVSCLPACLPGGRDIMLVMYVACGLMPRPLICWEYV